MIVVLADDLSGAAELAGAAWHLGFSAEVQRRCPNPTPAEVLCLDSDTRALPQKEASRAVARCARAIQSLSPSWIYKKTDSVLRGHVAEEIHSLAETVGLSQAILIPANPSKGRVIRQGRYWIHDRLLHQTFFAHDPEFPRTTSSMRDLLYPNGEPPASRLSCVIATPDVAQISDLTSWTTVGDARCLLAGGVDFFKAALRARASESRPGGPRNLSRLDKTPILFVCGSAAAWAGDRRQQCRRHKIPIVLMPRELFDLGQEQSASQALIDAWSKQTRRALERHPKVMVAIGDGKPSPPLSSACLVQFLAAMLQRLMQRCTVRSLLLEGGATASALFDRMDWHRLEVTHEIHENLTAFQPESNSDIQVVIKPGSYPWPESVW